MVTLLATGRARALRVAPFLGLLMLGLVLSGCGGDKKKEHFNPKADAAPFGGPVPLKVKFTASAGEVDGPISYHWCFDDGTVSNEQNPTHLFKTPGYYLVAVDIEGKKLVNRATRSLFMGAWPPELWTRSQKGFKARTIKRNIEIQRSRTRKRQAALRQREKVDGPTPASKQPCGQLSRFGPEPPPGAKGGLSTGTGSPAQTPKD